MLAKETLIIIRFNQIRPGDITNLHSFINIHGSKSGDIRGKTIICKDQKTLNFKPEHDFMPGERVSVSISLKMAGSAQSVLDSTYYFDVSPITQISTHLKARRSRIGDFALEKYKISKANTRQTPRIINGVSVPSEFPEIKITINDNPDTGLIFLTQDKYSLIIDNEGTPLWYWLTDGGPFNLKVQHGLMTVCFLGNSIWGRAIAMDSTYTIVREFQVPEGYDYDVHELRLLPNGNYLMIVMDVQEMDLTYLGGQPDCRVRGNHVAELDAGDNLVFFWRSWDYFDVADAVHEDPTGGGIDYIHMNSIDVDLDGHIIISSRHLSEITKINHQTGDIIWRLGGENDYFTWVNDSNRISYQHDARVLPNGNITLFDNGNNREPEFSRALELSVDTTTWQVTKIWEYRSNPGEVIPVMGNVQRLPNGNTGIYWGFKFNEVQPDMSDAFELNLDLHYISWSDKVHRFFWKSKAVLPYLVIEPYPDRIRLIFNKFGDTSIREYRIYTRTDTSAEQLLASTSETFINLRGLENNQTYYFKVTAVDSVGIESDFSNEEEVYVNISESGENPILNGDFSMGAEFWELLINENVSAQGTVEDGVFHIQIDSSGSRSSDVQLRQKNIYLSENSNYILEFDARSSEPRIFDVRLQKSTNPFTDYSQIGAVYSTEEQNHYYYEFIMESKTDYSAQIVFDCGQSAGDLFIDNVSLTSLPPETIIKNNLHLPSNYKLNFNYPNPFNPVTMINYQLPMISEVDLSIYNLLGQKIKSLVNERQQAGFHQVEWDATGFSSGIYYYRLEAGNFIQTRKMIYLK